MQELREFMAKFGINLAKAFGFILILTLLVGFTISPVIIAHHTGDDWWAWGLVLTLLIDIAALITYSDR